MFEKKAIINLFHKNAISERVDDKTKKKPALVSNSLKKVRMKVNDKIDERIH